MTAPLRVGVVGAGVISDTYLQNLTSFPDIAVLAVGDLVPERAAAKAAEYEIPFWGSGEEILAHPDVDLVVNLTLPAVHVEISRAAIAAGKHVWTEKPLGLDRAAAKLLLAEADAASLRVGCAPDTLLGAGFQTARRAIDEGLIGEPLFVQTVFQTQGPDAWHPDPAFLFAEGAGPLLDMGPYYFSALISALGPIVSVAARGSRPQRTRTIRSGSRAGETFAVEVPSTIQALTSFAGGQHGTHLLSFDSALERAGIVEIHGSEGSMILPDPNAFEGRIAYVRPVGTITDANRGEQKWIEVKQKGPVVGRGLGVLDMARAIREDRPHVASGALAYHVLDVMLSTQEAAASGQNEQVKSTVAPVPMVPSRFDPFASTL